jgi:hypothetical protein
MGLQLGIVYVSRAAHKEDRGLRVDRRHQLKVLVGDNNIKGDRNKKTCGLLTSNCTQIGQNVWNVPIHILLRSHSSTCFSSDLNPHKTTSEHRTFIWLLQPQHVSVIPFDDLQVEDPSREMEK